MSSAVASNARFQFNRDAVPDWRAYADREGLELVGRGKWLTGPCAMHGGSDSMRVNTESGGWCCMSCGAKGGDTLSHYQQVHGVDFIEAARALGCWQEGDAPAVLRRPRTLAARDALELLHADTMLTWVAAENLANGIVLTDQDRAALAAAARRVLLVSQEHRP